MAPSVYHTPREDKSVPGLTALQGDSAGSLVNVLGAGCRRRIVMGSTRKKSDIYKLRVMVVDDDKSFLSEVDEVLSLSGYKTTAFADGRAALKWARAKRPDVIILDIKMDGMDGFQLTKNLKRFAETAGIPVIAMTGHFTGEEHGSTMQGCGIETCLKKPFNALSMLKHIELALAVRARGEVKGAGRAVYREEPGPGSAQAAAAHTP